MKAAEVVGSAAQVHQVAKTACPEASDKQTSQLQKRYFLNLQPVGQELGGNVSQILHGGRILLSKHPIKPRVGRNRSLNMLNSLIISTSLSKITDAKWQGILGSRSDIHSHFGMQ